MQGGAAGAILVYDITSYVQLIHARQELMRRRQSFEDLSRWLTDCRALASPHLVTVLVGNKVDKEEDREVEYLEGSRWAQENGKSSHDNRRIRMDIQNHLS